MLITDRVILNWSPRNKTYLISKGYLFTKYGNGVLVKTEDLSRKNASIVEYMCDICFEKYKGRILQLDFGV